MIERKFSHLIPELFCAFLYVATATRTAAADDYLTRHLPVLVITAQPSTCICSDSPTRHSNFRSSDTISVRHVASGFN